MAKSDSYQINVPGGSIYVKKWTPTKVQYNSPVVLLHDSLGSVDLWKKFPEILAEHLSREVIAYDRLGFGRSSVRQELPNDDFVWEEADIYFPVLKEQLNKEMKQHLNINSYILFGHSVGGGMSIGIAAKDSDCVAVITESAQAFVEELTLEGIREAQKFFQQEGHIERLEKWHGDKASWVLKAWTNKWLSEEFRDWSLASRIKDVRCPLLAIHGDKDEYGSIAFPRYISENSSGESRMEIIENCGHVPHRQSPEAVLGLCEKFLSEIN